MEPRLEWNNHTWSATGRPCDPCSPRITLAASHCRDQV